MARRTVAIGALSEAVMAVLSEYVEDVDTLANETAQKVAKKAARRVRSTSPVRTGRYKKGWKVKEDFGRLSQRFTYTVHNKDRYQLAHLLEHGHATKNGTGRTYGSTPAHAHISPVEAQMVAEYEKEIERVLNHGT